MTIEYLKEMEQNPKRGIFENEGMSLLDIQQLEQDYNNGNPFPKILKELLFLAGNYRSYLDNGELLHCFNSIQHQNEMVTELIPIFQKYKLGSKFNVGGSALTKIPPPDLDIVLYLTPKEYDEIIKYYSNMLQKFKNWAKATKRTSLYKQQFKEIEDALKAAKNPQNAKVGNIKKMPLNCVFHFEEIPNGLPNISYLKNDLYGTKNSNGCLFLNNLNVSSTKKINKLDFSIYNVPQGTKDISLYPEATFNL